MIKSLEGMRGIAAMIVALYHLGIGVQYAAVIRHGYLFVDLFFVLSGFVICSAYAHRMDRPGALKEFVLRRFGRLFPLLIFSTLAFVLVVNAIALGKDIALANGLANYLNRPAPGTYLIPSATELLATISMTHGLGVFDRLILNTPSWSISVEFFTYLLFAVVFLMVRPTQRVGVFVALALTGTAISIWASTVIHDCVQQSGCLSLTYDYGLARCVADFFLGALTYRLSRTMRFNEVMLQSAALGGLVVLLMLIDSVPVAAFGFPMIFAALILGFCKDRGWLASMLSTAPFQMLGQRSYSIYMMHMPLLLLFDNFSKRYDGLAFSTLIVLTYVGALFVLSGWTYRHIEDPFRMRFNRLASPENNSAAAPRDGDAKPNLSAGAGLPARLH